MSEPLILGLGPYDASRAGQIHSLPLIYRLVPVLALSSNDDLHLRRRLRFNVAYPDAHQCCRWWYRK